MTGSVAVDVLLGEDMQAAVLKMAFHLRWVWIKMRCRFSLFIEVLNRSSSVIFEREQ